MEKIKVQEEMDKIENGLKNTYYTHGKKFRSTVTKLPHSLLKKIARKRLYEQESYQLGSIGRSPVATVLSRRERREGVHFVPMYNGKLFKLVRKVDEETGKVIKTYEEIEG